MCIKKFIFLRKKPKIIVVGGASSSLAVSAIFHALKKFFEIEKTKEKFGLKEILKNEILIWDFSPEISVRKLKFWLKRSSLPILLITNLGEIPFQDFIFASERSPEIEKLAEFLPPFGYLILNFDDETVRAIGDKLNVYSLTFGLAERADLRATDYHSSKTGTTFKLNFKGNILPVWLPRLILKKNVYAALSALSIAQVFNLNLVDVSQALKNWQGIEGEGRIIEGIKNTILLDDSKNASSFSMVEALKVLGEIGGGRRIAVLGDILGIGKYTIEAHEAIGEEVRKNADLLFTVGARAKFIAKGARDRGMPADNIFEFDQTKTAGLALQREMKEGDLILIDGSSEMEMKEIVREVKKFDKIKLRNPAT